MSPAPQPSRATDPAAALENVIADEEAETDGEAVRWAANELIDGREPGLLVEELVGNGWADADAERIVETARQQTREERGVLTRETVVRDLNVDYRRATAGMSVAFRSGMFGLYGFTAGLMAAWRTARKLARWRAR